TPRAGPRPRPGKLSGTMRPDYTGLTPYELPYFLISLPASAGHDSYRSAGYVGLYWNDYCSEVSLPGSHRQAPGRRYNHGRNTGSWSHALSTPDYPGRRPVLPAAAHAGEG